MIKTSSVHELKSLASGAVNSNRSRASLAMASSRLGLAGSKAHTRSNAASHVSSMRVPTRTSQRFEKLRKSVDGSIAGKVSDAAVSKASKATKATEQKSLKDPENPPDDQPDKKSTKPVSEAVVEKVEAAEEATLPQQSPR